LQEDAVSTDDDLVRPPSPWPRLLAVVVVVALVAWVIVSIISSLLHALFVVAVIALLGCLVWRLVAGSRR
jgi:Flp pilus assembly protein TadB